MSATQRFAVGELVWAYTGGEQSFQKGTVERFDSHKGSVHIRVPGGAVDVKDADVHKVNAETQDGVPDNTYLRELNEATLLHNVRTRYNDKDDGGCYSNTGHILIAVNPFRPLKIYEEENVRGTLRAIALLACPARPRMPGRNDPRAECRQARPGPACTHCGTPYLHIVACHLVRRADRSCRGGTRAGAALGGARSARDAPIPRPDLCMRR